MKRNGPWDVEKSKTIYQNRWLTLQEDIVHRKNVKSVFGFIRLQDGAHVLPLDNEGNAYFLKEFRYGIGKNIIEIAGGAVEKNESPLMAAKRELAEELGIKAKKMIKLAIAYPLPTYARYKIHLYLAQELQFSNATPEHLETFSIIKMPFEKALKLVDEGKIHNSLAIITILKAARWVERNG